MTRLGHMIADLFDIKGCREREDARLKTERIKEAESAFNIISSEGGAYISYKGVRVTSADECSLNRLTEKLFELREYYVKHKANE